MPTPPTPVSIMVKSMLFPGKKEEKPSHQYVKKDKIGRPPSVLPLAISSIPNDPKIQQSEGSINLPSFDEIKFDYVNIPVRSSVTRQLAFGDNEKAKLQKWHSRKPHPCFVAIFATFLLAVCIGLIIWVRTKEYMNKESVSKPYFHQNQAHEKLLETFADSAIFMEGELGGIDLSEIEKINDIADNEMENKKRDKLQQ